MPGADEGGDSPTELSEILAQARRAGFLGPGPLQTQVRHAEGFADVARALGPRPPHAPPPLVVDLGSGGGLPGLVVATRWPEASLVLLDASARRTDFLRRAVEDLGLGSRVQVVCLRAEEFGREARWRGAFDGVLSRSFGRPAVVAECAAPLLQIGGWLVVSEPPDVDGSPGDPSRWPADALRGLGLEPEAAGEEGHGFAFQVLRQVELCPERFPRRNGVPSKKPLF